MENKLNVNTLIAIVVILLVVLLIVITILKLNENKKMGQENKITPSITRTPQKTITQNDDFTTSFLKMENEEKNMIYSPLSIKYALSMLKEGANGNTKLQIENVIKELTLPQYKSQEKVLSLANSIYIRDTYEQYVRGDYKSTLMGKYNAEINCDTFKNATNINNWIENKTLGIIKNMLKDEMVKNSKMLLINALAIDMKWEFSFDSNDTYGNKFNLANGSTMNATTLHNEMNNENVLYYKGNDITALTMNLKKYEDVQLDFTAIMPNERLSDYINEFNEEKFKKIICNLKKASEAEHGIEISIPKFSFDYDLELKKDLIQLGITDAFNEKNADFSNMTKNLNGLYVNEALHKADIEFTEEGVKAAAVTVMAMMESAYIKQYKPEEIKFDKPFLFIIRDKSNGEIWFLGTVYEPHSWDKDKTEYNKQ